MKEVWVIIQRHLNKLRWTVLTLIFSMLILLPFLHLYQTYEAAHAYDLLSPTEKSISDTMEWISKPFVDDPEVDLNNLKGTIECTSTENENTKFIIRLPVKE